MEKFCPQCEKRFDASVGACPDDGANLIEVEGEDLVGQVLDKRYKVVRKLGAGGMGVVYEAEQTMIGRKVALKVLNKDFARDEATVKRFLIEAKAIASLTSPHTVTLYDFGVSEQGLLYYTMELLVGEDLKGLLKRQGAVPPADVVAYMKACCHSLGEAHRRGILHRDIKPENIFLLRGEGGDIVPKVLDFGIAKLIGDESLGSVTRTGMICGTPMYMPPERVVGEEASAASDLYSLGIVVYELLAGIPPFDQDTAVRLMMRHMSELPPPLSVRRPDVPVPPQFEAFVQKALAKDATQRFTTASEFAEALEAALEGRAPTYDAPTLQAPAQAKQPGAAPAVVSRDAVTGAAMNRPEPASSKKSRAPLFGGAAALAVAAGVVVWAPWKGSEPAPAPAQVEVSKLSGAAPEATTAPSPKPASAPAAESPAAAAAVEVVSPAAAPAFETPRDLGKVSGHALGAASRKIPAESPPEAGTAPEASKPKVASPASRIGPGRTAKPAPAAVAAPAPKPAAAPPAPAAGGFKKLPALPAAAPPAKSSFKKLPTP